jgi:hypothetical protein
MCHTVRFLTVAAAMLLATAAPGAAESGRTMPMSMHSEAAAAFKQDMRKLWTDHVVWTRDLKMSDAIADGIVKQFKDKFGAKPTTTSGH